MTGNGTIEVEGVTHTLHNRQLVTAGGRELVVTWQYRSGKKGYGSSTVEVDWRSDRGWVLRPNYYHPTIPAAVLDAMVVAMPQSELDYLASLIARWRIGLPIKGDEEYHNFHFHTWRR